MVGPEPSDRQSRPCPHVCKPSTSCAAMRARSRSARAPLRSLTCSPRKPQGLPAARLAELAKTFAQGGVDYIKDDHGLADQAYSPFAARVEAVAAALRSVAQSHGRAARYVPSLSGDLD